MRQSIAAAALCAALGTPAAQAQELINNGGFEGGLAGWTVDTWAGSAGALTATGALAGPISGLPQAGPYEGSLFALTDQGGPGAYALTQTFNIGSAPVSATFSFAMYVNNWAPATTIGPDFNPFGTYPNQYVSVDLFAGAVGGFVTSAPLQNFFKGATLATNNTPNPWVVYSFDVTSLLSAPGSYTVRFAEVDNQLFHNMGVDRVSLRVNDSTVPEPGTLLLLGSGVAALAAARRRRRQAAS